MWRYSVANIDFMILPAGEGKTRWLVSKAFDEVNMGSNVYLLAHNSKEYDKFLTYYRSEYRSRCPVRQAKSLTDIPYDAVVLIDDVEKQRKHLNFNLEDIKNICKKIFATVEGKRQ